MIISFCILIKNIEELIKKIINLQQIFSQTNFQYVCECGFSCLNREKPVLRTRLREHILGHIMHINIDDPSLDNCDTVKFVSDWIESTITS